MKSVCYTNGLALPAANISWAPCTHIIYTFLQLDASGSIKDPQGSSSYLASLVGLKVQNPNLKIMVAFGGASGVNYADWTTVVGNPVAISNFANQALNYIKANKLDGVGEFKVKVKQVSC